jgi:hypothetical protein
MAVRRVCAVTGLTGLFCEFALYQVHPGCFVSLRCNRYTWAVQGVCAVAGIPGLFREFAL